MHLNVCCAVMDDQEGQEGRLGGLAGWEAWDGGQEWVAGPLGRCGHCLLDTGPW